MAVRLEGVADYLIFLDNVRVDGLVKSWSVQLGVNQMGQATISMLYFDELYDAIDHRTNLKIFVRNMFNLRYCMVFDGELQARSRVRRGPDWEIEYMARDYQSWLAQTPNPLFFGAKDQMDIVAAQKFTWNAYGIDFTQVDGIMTQNQLDGLDQNLAGLLNTSKNIMDRAYALQNSSNRDSVYAWADFWNRISIMADIDPTVNAGTLKGMRLITSGNVMKSLYDTILTLSNKLMMEMYQDRDGLIRIKPSFWNTDILKTHIIDPSLEIDATERTNWENRVTRTLVQGGAYAELAQSTAAQVLTPLGFYSPATGYISSNPVPVLQKPDNQSTVYAAQDTRLNMWLNLDPSNITSPFGPRNKPESEVAGVIEPDFHHGIDLGYTEGTPVYSLYAGTATPYWDDDTGNSVAVDLDPPYSDIRLLFCHLRDFGSIMYESDTGFQNKGYKLVKSVHVSVDDMLGYVGHTGRRVTGPHLHFGVLQKSTDEYIDPLKWLKTWADAAKQQAERNQIEQKYGLQAAREFDKLQEESESSQVDINKDTLFPEMLRIGEEERRYGIYLNMVQHELIRDDSRLPDIKHIPLSQLLSMFAKMTYDHANAEKETTTFNVVAMPWLRPGFNVWYDPAGASQIYYLQTINHSGSVEGVFTSLGVIRARTVSEHRSALGQTPTSGWASLDNFLLTSVYALPSVFGEVVGYGDYDKQQERARAFQKSFTVSTANKQAHQCAYLRDLYNNPTPQNVHNGVISNQLLTNYWSGDLTAVEIRNRLSAEYASAPSIVQDRANKINTAFNKVRDRAIKRFLMASPEVRGRI